MAHDRLAMDAVIILTLVEEIDAFWKYAVAHDWIGDRYCYLTDRSRRKSLDRYMHKKCIG